jgi:hypothetical protein
VDTSKIKPYIKGLNKTLISLFIFDFTIRFFYIFKTDNNFFGDATARLEAILWQTKSLSPLPHSDWLPFPFWINGLVARTFDDLFYAPRVLSALFASLCIIAIYKLCLNLFNKSTAIISCLLFTFSIQLLLIESITLSEPFFHFFSISLLYFYFKKQTSKIDLVMIYTFSAFLCLTRLEGWVLCGILFICSLTRKNFRFSYTIFLGTGSGVIYWEAVSTFMGKGLFRALLFSDHEVGKVYEEVGYDIWEIILRSGMGFTMLTILGVAFGYILVRKSVEARHYYFICLLFLMPAIYKIFNKTLFSEFRYFTVYAITFLPILGIFLSKVTQNLTKIKKIATLGSFIIVCILIDYNLVTSFFDLKHHTQLPNGIIDSARYVKNNIEPRDKIFFLDFDNTWDRDLWTAYADVISRNPSKYCKVESHTWLGQVFTPESINKCLTNGTQAYLILFPNGLLNRYFNSKDNVLSENYNIKIIKDFSGYRIIELKDKLR